MVQVTEELCEFLERLNKFNTKNNEGTTNLKHIYLDEELPTCCISYGDLAEPSYSCLDEEEKGSSELTTYHITDLEQFVPQLYRMKDNPTFHVNRQGPSTQVRTQIDIDAFRLHNFHKWKYNYANGEHESKITFQYGRLTGIIQLIGVDFTEFRFQFEPKGIERFWKSNKQKVRENEYMPTIHRMLWKMYNEI